MFFTNLRTFISNYSFIKRFRAFEKTLKTPTTDEIQKWSPCAICWANYDDDNMTDVPIKLPCGHVYGRRCLLNWASGHSTSGRPNRCPHCHAELLAESKAKSRLSCVAKEFKLICMLTGGAFGLLASVLWIVGTFILAIDYIKDDFLENVACASSFMVWTIYLSLIKWRASGCWKHAALPLLLGGIICGCWILVAWCVISLERENP